jgi:hypothetical protein
VASTLHARVSIMWITFSHDIACNHRVYQRRRAAQSCTAKQCCCNNADAKQISCHLQDIQTSAIGLRGQGHPIKHKFAQPRTFKLAKLRKARNPRANALLVSLVLGSPKNTFLLPLADPWISKCLGGWDWLAHWCSFPLAFRRDEGDGCW